MPSACATRRSVPRKTSRSKPDNTPVICRWCLAINFCTAFLLSFRCGSWNNHIVRRAGTPFLVAAPPRYGRLGISGLRHHLQFEQVGEQDGLVAFAAASTESEGTAEDVVLFTTSDANLSLAADAALVHG